MDKLIKLYLLGFITVATITAEVFFVWFIRSLDCVAFNFKSSSFLRYSIVESFHSSKLLLATTTVSIVFAGNYY